MKMFNKKTMIMAIMSFFCAFSFVSAERISDSIVPMAIEADMVDECKGVRNILPTLRLEVNGISDGIAMVGDVVKLDAGGSFDASPCDSISRYEWSVLSDSSIVLRDPSQSFQNIEIPRANNGTKVTVLVTIYDNNGGSSLKETVFFIKANETLPDVITIPDTGTVVPDTTIIPVIPTPPTVTPTPPTSSCSGCGTVFIPTAIPQTVAEPVKSVEATKTVVSQPTKKVLGEKIESKKINPKFIKRLSVGSKGTDVKKLQEMLKTLGYFKGDTTNTFGNVTRNAVKAFQKANKLQTVGYLGPQTIKALNLL